MIMKHHHIMVCALLLLTAVSALLPVASNPLLEVTSYEDEGIARSLGGTNCKSTADVNCYLGGTFDKITGIGVPCKGNMKIMKSQCRSGPQKQDVDIKWKYCNEENRATQKIYPKLTEAKFKQLIIPDNRKQLDADDCVNLKLSTSIDLCKAGAPMSIKYEGKIKGNKRSYCYAYKFLRVKTIALKEKKCGSSAEVSCRINDNGKNQGEPCAGNLIFGTGEKNSDCGKAAVQFVYKVCIFNKDAKKFIFNRKKTIARLNAENVRIKTTDMGTKKPCRVDIIDDFIDTCSEIGTGAVLKVRGKLNTGRLCQSSGFLIIRPAKACDYNFIITELVSNGAASYIEIYSKNCRNTIVSEDFQLVRYKPNQNPNPDTPVNLKGLTTDDNGFIVICSTYQVGKPFCGDKDSVCAALNPETVDDVGKSSIAIIEGTVEGDPVIRDIFGSIPRDVDGKENFQSGLAVRKESNTDPKDFYRDKDWIIKKNLLSNSPDPKVWFDIGEPLPKTCPPTSIPLSTTPPTLAPTNEPTRVPTEGPTPLPLPPPPVFAIRSSAALQSII
mmetsp:Transcript_26862/g.31718  ORF Transcript_26862/g.31718 Transcript_26862/m.31718 type:complete len:554 (+) Transcript_26862:57-1718(+)